MFGKSGKSKVLLFACAVLTLALCVSASAEVVMTYDSVMTGTLGNINLNSVVTKNGDLYTYTYNMDYYEGTNYIHAFAVANWNDLEFINALNDQGFTNPVFQSGEMEVKWVNTVGLAPHGKVTFSYDSYYAPQEIPVFAYAINGGKSAEGTALGMTTFIPEPSAFAGLALPLLGLAPKLLRRKR